MLYDIDITITYEYEAPAHGGRHILRLVPRNLGDVQRVIASTLDCTPRPEEQVFGTDFFGNRLVSIRYGDAVRETKFHMRARVERQALRSASAESPTLPNLKTQLHDFQSLDAESPHHFLAPSTRVQPDLSVSSWTRALVEEGQTVFDIASRVTAALDAEMTFDSDYTAVDMPLSEAFAARRGVCQDFTHIMIAGLRSLGIPAAYVSGFLRTIPPEGQSRLEGADAMHAWVRVWCGREMGWVEFDPTNNLLAGEDHVVVAYGRDYFDVAPVKGHLRLTGEQKTEQAVDMVTV